MLSTPVTKDGGDQLPRNIISLCGERRRGKDYLTSLLMMEAGFPVVRLSFSDEVRRLAQIVFPWFDAFDESQKETVYKHPNNTRGVTGRDILLTVGKVRDVDGQYFARAFLNNQIRRAIANPESLFVITDFRTSDEYDTVIQPYRIPTIKIIRDVDPKEYPPQAFEEYIRNFNADMSFKNDGDGRSVLELVNMMIDEGNIVLRK